MSDPNGWIVFWTALASIAALATMVTTAASVRMSFVMWRSQTEPKVIVYAKHDRERPSLIVIVIENIGHDVATDVKFNPSRPIPMEAFGIDKPNRVPKTAQSGPLAHGIRSLGPGDKRILTWGQYGGISEALNYGAIEVAIEYRHGKRKMHGVGVLEVQSHLETDASAPPIVEISRHLGKVAKSVDAMQSANQSDRWAKEAERKRQKTGKFRGYATAHLRRH